LVFHLFGALGRFEHDLIQERTRAGLVAAATRGRKGGRKPVVTAEKLERACITTDALRPCGGGTPTLPCVSDRDP
jgi:DNA invertase Pin-like site-specific DNA recombinase